MRMYPALRMLILASSSPRRRDLLTKAGLFFDVVPAEIPEEHRPGESAKEFAERLAREKAQAVASRHPQAYVLGADTIVVVDNEIFGKPSGSADAERMLRALSARAHEVITAVCLIAPDGGIHTESESTRVHFGELSEADIRSYVATGEPLDKAGAYAGQGIASRWIERVDGDYLTMVGLPVARVWRMLQRSGYRPC